MALAAQHNIATVLVPGGATLPAKDGEDNGKVQTIGARFANGELSLQLSLIHIYDYSEVRINQGVGITCLNYHGRGTLAGLITPPRLIIPKRAAIIPISVISIQAIVPATPCICLLYTSDMVSHCRFTERCNGL